MPKWKLGRPDKDKVFWPTREDGPRAATVQTPGYKENLDRIFGARKFRRSEEMYKERKKWLAENGFTVDPHEAFLRSIGL